MKTVYLVTERHTEYDDERYSITEGYVVKNGFATLEEAKKEAKSKNLEYIKDFNLSDFEYSHEVDQLLDSLEGVLEEETISGMRDEPYYTTFDKLFKMLKKAKREDLVDTILNIYDLVTVVTVQVKE